MDTTQRWQEQNWVGLSLSIMVVTMGYYLITFPLFTLGYFMPTAKPN